MKERKHNSTILLMAISMVLLLILQGLWLRGEYRSAANAFNRETNLLFRTTVHQISDSLFFSMFRFTSDGEGQFSGRIEAGNDADSQPVRVISIRVEDVVDEKDPAVQEVDTVRSQHDMRFMFRNFAEAFDEDSLSRHFQITLNEHNKQVSFEIIKREMSRSYRPDRWRHEPQDTIPFTTSFVPLGWSAYAAKFENVRPLLIKRILPQIGFSVFITLVILLSFILVYRALLAQKRLLVQQNDFIGNITHELKTPVATVGVALEAMRNFNVLKDTEKARQYINMATQELNRLGMMTDKILRTSVFDYETDIRQNRSVVNMEHIIENVLSSFSLLAEKEHISLVFERNGETTLLGHEEHLAQMFYNLVDNAFKYAGDGPDITITLAADEKEVFVVVADKGPGIEEQHASKIFNKFYRVPTGNVHTVKGYGMGLHYVKGVVLSHGGRISLDSKPGEGSGFRIRLPKNTV